MKILSSSSRISRRRFLASAAACGGMAAIPSLGYAQEEPPILLLGARGGLRGDAADRATMNPFMEVTGIQIQNVPYPNLARLQAMVDTNTVDIDLHQTGGREIITLSRRGYLEPIDYAQLRPDLKDDLVPGAALEYGLGASIYGQGIIYNTDTFDADNHPRTWAEFWDTERFPGPRTLPDGTQDIGPYEAALMADGVPASELYPLDVDRAFASLDRIKPHVVKWWASSAEGLHLLTSGEAVLGNMTFGLIITTKLQGEQIPLNVELNDGFAKNWFWVIPKGAPHPRNAHRLLDFYYDPQRYADYMNAYPAYAASIRSAAPFIKEESRQTMLDIDQMHLLDYGDAWWTETDSAGVTNLERLIQRWTSWISA